MKLGLFSEILVAVGVAGCRERDAVPFWDSVGSVVVFLYFIGRQEFWDVMSLMGPWARADFQDFLCFWFVSPKCSFEFLDL